MKKENRFMTALIIILIIVVIVQSVQLGIFSYRMHNIERQLERFNNSVTEIHDEVDTISENISKVFENFIFKIIDYKFGKE